MFCRLGIENTNEAILKKIPKKHNPFESLFLLIGIEKKINLIKKYISVVKSFYG